MGTKKTATPSTTRTIKTTTPSTTPTRKTATSSNPPTINTATSHLTSTTPTNSTDSAPLKQDKQIGSASSQITDVHIGIIVGTAVAAIIVTVIILCVIWKIKTRHNNNPSNNSNGSKHGSATQSTSPNNAVRNETNTNKKNNQQPSPVSALPASNLFDDGYSHISLYHNPVDVASTVSPSNTDRHVPAELPQNSAYSTALEIAEDTNPSVYSHLRENNAIPANVYNIGPNEQDTTITNRANLTGASQNPSLNDPTTFMPVYSTIEHSNPGIQKTKKKETRSIPVQYNEIDPAKRMNNSLNNHNPAIGQQTAKDQPSRDDQILPKKQTKPNNNYYDIDLPEPSQILPDKQSKPNNNYFELELPEPDHIPTDDQATLTPLYANAAVLATRRHGDKLDKSNPTKGTDKIYFNAV